MFADNERISSRQLFSQIVIAMAGVLLLYLPGSGNIQGIGGVLSCILAFVLLMAYCFFLTRIAHAFRAPEKVIGVGLTRAMGIWYLSFFIFTGAFLTNLVTQVVATYLVTGVSPYVMHAVILLACTMAGTPDIQRRGRMGEACLPVCLGILLLLLLLAAFQEDYAYLEQNMDFKPQSIAMGTYEILVAFTALGALPFLLSQVKGHRCSRMISATAVLLGVLGLALLLLQGSFGTRQVMERPWPIMALLGGVRIPGNLLARFDPLWIALFVLLLLFAVGSTLFYSNYIARRTSLSIKWYWIVLAVYLVSLTKIGIWSIEKCYQPLLFYVYTPSLFLIQIAVGIAGRRRKA